MTRTYRWPAGLAVLVAAAAVGLAACGSGSSSTGVASLVTSPATSSGGGSSTGSPASSGPNGNPTQLLAEFAACMRANGFPDWPNPTTDASKVIHVILPSNGSTKGGEGGKVSFPAGCQKDLNAASLALSGGHTPKPPSAATLEKFAECMRANGVPGFPDPISGSGVSGFKLGSNGSGLNPNSPAYQQAAKLCDKQTGGSSDRPPGTILVQPPQGAAAAAANG